MVKRITSIVLSFIVLVMSFNPMMLKVNAYSAAYELPSLTGNQAIDTANIASSQIGYTFSNGTVYGEWWTGVTNWGVDYTKSGWCGMFACWCANKAGAGLNIAYNKNGASPSLLLDWYKNNATYDLSFSSSPKAGDFLFFGTSGGAAQHVAIVTGYNSSTNIVSFVGGNQGSGVGKVSRSSCSWKSGTTWGTQYVIGYGRPKYSNNEPDNSIRISFNANGGSCGTSSKSISAGGKIGTLPTPVRTGYDFAGWYVDGGYELDPVNSSTTFSESTTLYAYWANRQFSGNKLTFDTNGGSLP